jgi:class 3 adenylate cyclase
MVELPSGTVTFLFTDLEVLTRLWEQEPDAMRGALARHDHILREAIAKHGGHVVKGTGDGVHAVFVTADAAVGAATDAQSALGAQEWPVSEALRVRIGIHTGVAELREGDYFGSAVNRAARVMAVAHGGQILCSRATVEVAGEAFPVRNLGAHRLRDLAAPQELFQVGDGVFPPLRSVDVVPTNLPTTRTELIGRSEDVVALSELVSREQLVTLTGVGGVGKTCFAFAVMSMV